MKTVGLMIMLFVVSLFSSCFEEGCTDSNSLNYDINATQDNGTCAYSKVIFYGTIFSPCPPVSVQVNGSSIGSIQAVYPNGPGNCSVPGVAQYNFNSGETIDWIATDACGFIFSGTLRPSRNSDCIKVKVF